MKKRLFLVILIVFTLCLNMSIGFAMEVNGITEQEIIQKYEQIKKERERLKKSRDAKFEIIRNNNNTISTLKVQVLKSIEQSSKKIDDLMYKIKNNKVVITQELVDELTNLLGFMQTSNNIIKSEASQLQEIVKMIKVKGYDSSVLTVLDSAIEKQNSIIVNYKQIIQKLNSL